jgi:hypothetical protein
VGKIFQTDIAEHALVGSVLTVCFWPGLIFSSLFLSQWNISVIINVYT